MGDSFDIVAPTVQPERTPTHWLISQALRLLNTDGKSAELGYAHVLELLKDRRDAVSMTFELLRSAPAEDVGLRWSALHIVGDIEDLSAAKYLFRESLKPLPKRCREKEGCEGPRDGELLVRTMAVEALRRVAARHEEARGLVLELIEQRPEQPVLIEAVKAAQALGIADAVRKVLRKKDRWILEIRLVPVDKITAQPERRDDSPLGHAPPGVRAHVAGPIANCSVLRKED